MDIPINLLQWEVFLPERYKVKDFGGDAISESMLPANMQISTDLEEVGDDLRPGVSGGALRSDVNIESLLPGQLGGYIVDPSGAMVTNARVTVTNPETGYAQSTTTDNAGRWLVSGLRSGPARIAVFSNGFKQAVHNIGYDSNRPTRYSLALQVAAATEMVMVEAAGTSLQTQESRIIERDRKREIAQEKKDAAQQQLAASANVYNFQRKVSGVLPVRVDVPRAGNSYRFVRPLVLDEETKVTFTYKTK
jgi:hypothetical protein